MFGWINPANWFRGKKPENERAAVFFATFLAASILVMAITLANSKIEGISMYLAIVTAWLCGLAAVSWIIYGVIEVWKSEVTISSKIESVGRWFLRGGSALLFIGIACFLLVIWGCQI